MQPTQTVLVSLGVNQMLGQAMSDQFDADTWTRQPAPGVNHALWIMAHIVGTRRANARHLGIEIPTDAWEQQAAFGSSCESPETYPAPAKLIAEFQSLGGKLTEAIGALSEADWQKTWPGGNPTGKSQSYAEALPFAMTHETMHLGQLSLMRRLNGLRGVVDVVMKGPAQG
ncbi:MAG: DinB family protein [Planctomycetota bacterium]